ncbi:MAG: S8 family serine peptidase [Candidatus Heimdallarchaeota archaeon]|nr:S8 family serine peptidase [Candidatus Heimdallarchaeota archaeon]
MRISSKSIMLIIILLTSTFTSEFKINLEISETLVEQELIIGSALQKTDNLDPRIWYLSDLGNVNPNDIIYEFQTMEGGLVHIDKSKNSNRNNGIDLTNSYFKIDNNDYLSLLQSQLKNENVNTELLDLEKPWEWGYTGENSVIAVIDTGIDFLHPSLIGKKIDERSFVKEELGYPSDESVVDLFGHGTSVSGLIVGNDPAYPEYRGVAYDAKLVNAKVANSDGLIFSSGLLAAIDWAANLDEVDVINISLGELEESPITDLLEKMANAAVKLGKLVVSSSGNDGKNGKNTFEPFTIGSPGSAVEAISVGAIDFNKNLASQSSEGPTMGWEVKPDFIAPGVNLKVPRLYNNYPSCTENLCYRFLSGTSFATPIISGVMALANSALVDHGLPNNPGIIKGTAHMVSSSIGLPWYQAGSGLINVTKMISSLVNGSYSGIILPKGAHHPKLTKIPAGEMIEIPVTVISDSLSSWTSYVGDGNASEFTSISFEEDNIAYSQIISLKINPTNGTSPGLYVYNYNITSTNGLIVASSLAVTVTEPVTYRLLLDLTHTPWDSVFASSSRHRLERLLGQDTQDLVDLLIENGVWVDELLTGRLTSTILDRYDVIWMPSVFVDPIPFLTDREPIRSQKISNEELMALYHFKQNGGKFIIDFGGRTVNDLTTDITVPDLSSLESLMSLFGLRISNVVDNKGFQTGIVDPELNFATTNYRTTKGVIQITNGIPIVTDGEYNQIAGYIGENQDMAFIVNNRNWRDESRLSDDQTNGPKDFAKAVVNWILKGDQISSFSISEIDDQLELSILFNETIIGNELFVSINSSQGIQELTDLSVNGWKLTTSFAIATGERFSVNITYGSETTIFQKEIDSQGPFIDVNMKQGSKGSNGELRTTWEIILLDNAPIPKYNSLVTILNSEDLIEINEIETGYSFTVSNSYIELNDIIAVVEIIDSLGQYSHFNLNLNSLLINSKSINDSDDLLTENLKPVIVSLSLILILTISYVTKRKRKL